MTTSPSMIPFRSGFKVRATMPFQFSDEVIKAEPQFWKSDPNFVKDKGGPIAKAFLDALPTDWYNSSLIIDARVHMLMEGWYPCIPGWHIDDVPRTREDGQPDHLHPDNKVEHLMAIVGDCSKTVFARGEFSLMDVPVGKGTVYDIWHKDIDGLVKRGVVQEVSAQQGWLIEFNQDSFHRGASATKRGWRWFIRASRKSNRPYVNEIRTQTQVYLTNPFGGW